MKNKRIKIGFLLTLCLSLAGVFNVGTAEANFAQAGTGCKVTKAGGSSMYVAATDKDLRLRRGTSLVVVDPEPHQGIIVVKTRISRKWTQGEIKLDDTNCVPILPR